LFFWFFGSFIKSIGKIREKSTVKKETNCWQCVYFRITHEIKRPYGCHAMGFKSKILPCYEVSKIDGNQCRSFTAKEARKG